VATATSGERFASAVLEADWRALLAHGRPRQYPRNTRVFCEGDPSDFVIAIREGLVKIVVTTEDGHESLLGIRGPGELVGELAALDPAPRAASAVALEALTVQTLTADEFRAFVTQHGRAALELMRMLIGRLREADRRRVEFGAYDALSRVARFLAQLAAEQEPHGRGGAVVRLSQHEIGELVGASRESVGRALASLRQRRLVTTGRRSVTVLDIGALRSFVG
jgi:CRP/FNR family transcriptional regulator, cyclic AMP receptor protein